MKPRHWALAAALGATLLLVWQGGQDTSDTGAIVEAVERGTQGPVVEPAAGATAQSAALPVTLPVTNSAQRMGEAAADLFAVRDWRPPPPPPVVEPPPKPTTPPLPFRYLGRWEENGALTVILGQGDQSVPARAGQVIDGQWRIDSIGAGRIEFTYLPLKTRASLALEEPQ